MATVVTAKFFTERHPYRALPLRRRGVGGGKKAGFKDLIRKGNFFSVYLCVV